MSQNDSARATTIGERVSNDGNVYVDEDARTAAAELSRSVGRVAMNWAHLETMSSFVLWTLAEVAVGRGAVLTNGVPLATQWDQIQILLTQRQLPAELGQWFKSWREGTGILQKRRNEAVHATWFPTGRSAEPFEAWDLVSRKARVDARRNLVPGGADAVHGLASEIRDAFRQLQKWLLKDIAAALGQVFDDEDISSVYMF